MIELQQWMRKSLLALLIVVGGVENAVAFSYVMMRDADLLAQSEFVAVGTVRDITDIADSTGMIVASRYTIEVERGIKGELAMFIKVDVPGVREPQAGRMWLPSAPHFFVEDRTLWFLEKLDDNRYQPMQYALGVFKLRRWENKDFAVRPLRGSAVLPQGGPGYQEPSNVRNLEGFVGYLQALESPAQARRSRGPQRNAAPVAADYFVTDELQRAEIAGELAESFTFISSGGRIFRWPDFDSGGTVQWRSNGGASYAGRIAEATSAWTNAAGSTISLAYAGTTTASTGLTGSDGINTVLFEDPNNEIGGAYSCSSGGTIGIGGPRSSGTHVADGIEYLSTIEGDVVFQNGASCLLDEFSGANAAESITHEIGHATGFSHSCGDGSSGSCDNNPSGDDEAVMRATLHGDGRGASLGADDIAGAASLYPGAGAGNQAPTVSAISNRSIGEGASTGAIGFTVNDVDDSENSLILTALSSNTGLIPNGNIVLGGSGANRTITVTAAASGSGVATITVTADDSSDTGSAAFSVTVAASANVAPTVSAIGNVTVEQNSGLISIPFTVNDADGEESALTVAAVSNNTLLLPNANISLSGSGASRSIAVTPASDQSGSAIITVTVSDGVGSDATNFQLDVIFVASNIAPTITTISSQVIEENSSTGPLPFSLSDPDGAISDLTLTAKSSNNTVISDSDITFSGTATQRTITVTPLPSRSGNSIITLTVSDGIDEEIMAFMVTVLEVNLLPTISAIGDRTIAQNESTGAVLFTIADDDNSIQELTVTASSSNKTLVPDNNIILQGSGAIRTVSVTASVGNTGNSVISLTVDDDTDTATSTFILTVSAVIDPLLVSSLADSGSGSLREVISSASDGDTVRFDVAVFPANADINDNALIVLNTAVPIDKNILIDGDFNSDGIADVAISSTQGIFELSTPSRLQLSGLHLTDADATRGAAVLIDRGGELTISHCVLSNNVADFGGAIAVLDGLLTVRDSEFVNNEALDGAAIAIADTAGAVDIQRTLFIGNTAFGEGGALYNAGAGSSLANVTVYDNSAGFGGGLFNAQGAILTANNITVFDNVGAGIGIAGGTVLLNNSLVAQVGAEDIAIVITNGGLAASFSLIESINGEFQNLGGNLFDIAPDFAAGAVPGNYGGLTRTLSPSSLSPVLDAADANIPGAGGTCETEDQTGKSRPIDGDADGAAICDMGAFEFSLISGAPPSTSSIEIVQEQYIAFYGRAGDPVGVQFWATRLDQLGGVQAAIQNEFGNSQEFIDLIVPDGLTTIEELTRQQKATLINNLYINMFARNVEGSAADPATGLGFWVSELDRPEVSLIDISTRIADGAQNIDSVVLASRVALARRITAEFVAQDKIYTGQFVESIRSFIFAQIDDENDNAQTVDVTRFIAELAN